MSCRSTLLTAFLAVVPALAWTQDDRPSPAVVALTCQVEGSTTLIQLLPERSRVKKGDLVAEFDASGLRDRLDAQRLESLRADVDVEAASQQLRETELELRIYTKTGYPAERERLETEQKLADLEQATARSRLSRLEALQKRMATPAEELEAAGVEVSRAALRIQQARLALAVLTQTQEREIQRLQGALKVAQARVLAAEAARKLHQQRTERLEAQLGACQILAPCNGRICYHNPTGTSPPLEPGAAVRFRQVVAEILPDPDAPSTP